jgi:hypothetical protein
VLLSSVANLRPGGDPIAPAPEMVLCVDKTLRHREHIDRNRSRTMPNTATLLAPRQPR